jgi:hypothetical protein
MRAKTPAPPKRPSAGQTTKNDGLPHSKVAAVRDGAGQPEALIESKTTQIPSAFTPGGKELAYIDLGAGNAQIWTVPLEDQGGRLKAGKPEQFLKSGFSDLAPSVFNLLHRAAPGPLQTSGVRPWAACGVKASMKFPTSDNPGFM